MVDTLIVPGVHGNHLSKTNTTLSASQTPSSLFPLSRVADDRPSQMFIFPALQANDYIEADITQVANGDFEAFTSGDPDDFTVNTTDDGLAAEETTGSLVVSGSGLQLTNGSSGTVEVYQDILVLSGERYRLDVHGRTSNGSEPWTLEIQNLQTGFYLTSSGTWQASQTNAISDASTSLTQVTLDFTVEGFSTTRRHECQLRVRMHMDGAAPGTQHNYDDLLLYPFVNLASIHGHNLDPVLTVELRSSTDGFVHSDDLQATFSLDEPTFYAELSPAVAARYWRIPSITGTNSERSGAIELGLCFLGYALALTRTPRNRGLELVEQIPQEVAATRLSREQWRVKRAKFQRRFVRLSFRHTQDMQREFRNQLLTRTNDGVDPMVIVVRDDRSNMAIHGRKPDGETSFIVEGGEVEQTEIIIEESAWGVVTN